MQTLPALLGLVNQTARRSPKLVASTLFLFLIVVYLGFSQDVPHVSTPRLSRSHWQAAKFKSFIAFGDSFTDEARGQYVYSFRQNGEQQHPPGVLLDESSETAVGGRTWARYVVQYTGSAAGGKWIPSMTLYNYAVGGSFCTSEIIKKKDKFLTVLEYQVPQFNIDASSTRQGTNEPYFQPALSSSNAVFALWLGANDLGTESFLTEKQVAGKTPSDFAECLYRALDGMYASGARTFVLMNPAPLDYAPIFADTNDKAGAEKMRILTTTVNSMLKYQTPDEVRVRKRYEGAHFAYFDVSSLLRHVHDNPTQYFNGSMAPDVEGYAMSYTKPGQDSPDSFFWRDQWHISEQTSRIIAKNFVEVLNGASPYATYWS